ncbi:hypothetical protein V8G54_030509, partial [Vigna mungo]
GGFWGWQRVCKEKRLKLLGRRDQRKRKRGHSAEEDNRKGSSLTQKTLQLNHHIQPLPLGNDQEKTHRRRNPLTYFSHLIHTPVIHHSPLIIFIIFLHLTHSFPRLSPSPYPSRLSLARTNKRSRDHSVSARKLTAVLREFNHSFPLFQMHHYAVHNA